MNGAGWSQWAPVAQGLQEKSKKGGAKEWVVLRKEFDELAEQAGGGSIFSRPRNRCATNSCLAVIFI